MSLPLASFWTETVTDFGGTFPIFYWQLPLILIVIGLVIFWVMYRKRQV